jgi:hypothetical protein
VGTESRDRGIGITLVGKDRKISFLISEMSGNAGKEGGV